MPGGVPQQFSGFANISHGSLTGTDGTVVVMTTMLEILGVTLMLAFFAMMAMSGAMASSAPRSLVAVRVRNRR
jgi:hypothetical protein